MTKWKTFTVRATPALSLIAIVVSAAAGKKWV
jgi:hypothetical protein